jgi:hypothetical protein
MASNSSRRTSPQKVVVEGLTTVPLAPTDLTSKNTVLYQIAVANKTASSVALYVKDKQSSAKILIPGVAIAGSGTALFEWQEGVLMLDGVNYNASAANALDVEIFGYVSTGS